MQSKPFNMSFPKMPLILPNFLTLPTLTRFLVSSSFATIRKKEIEFNRKEKFLISFCD